MKLVWEDRNAERTTPISKKDSLCSACGNSPLYSFYVLAKEWVSEKHFLQKKTSSPGFSLTDHVQGFVGVWGGSKHLYFAPKVF